MWLVVCQRENKKRHICFDKSNGRVSTAAILNRPVFPLGLDASPTTGETQRPGLVS